MAENYYHVVAFTGKGLRGNPAGVCLLTQPLPAARLQAIANGSACRKPALSGMTAT